MRFGWAKIRVSWNDRCMDRSCNIASRTILKRIAICILDLMFNRDKDSIASRGRPSLLGDSHVYF
jgi:hypothetical protein